MIEFFDHDPAHPFDVYDEKHIVQDKTITLNYAPLKGSVVIAGLTEDTTGATPPGTFFIRYDDENNYRTADQKVHFPDGYDGLAITVSYKGVSTLLRANHMNEIKAFMDRGASELAARIIAEHEQAMVDAWESMLETHCAHIVAAISEAGGGGMPQIATDDEADALLDEYFEGDVEEVGTTSIVASDEEADEVLDEFFPGEI